jgi:predicted transcriptional regulator
MAAEGLKKAKIDEEQSAFLLNIILQRVEKNRNGAKWMIKNFTTLLDKSTAFEASRSMINELYRNQMNSKPVHLWKDVDPEETDSMKRFGSVRDIMEKDLVIAKEDDLIDLVVSMMDWRNIRSIPVENNKHELVGLITVRDVLHYHSSDRRKRPELVKDLMKKDFVCVNENTTTEEAVSLLAETRACCLLVTQDKAISGIITESDIIQIANMTKVFKK